MGKLKQITGHGQRSARKRAVAFHEIRVTR
jgi:hypothetical protein